jgi:hypothetical protein
VGTGQDTGRLKLAQEIGADVAVDAEQTDDVTEAVIELCDGEGADLLIECSGAAPAAKTLTNVARRGARFCQIGPYSKPILFDEDTVCYKELVVTGTNASVTTSWTRALKLLVEGKVNVHRLISHRFPIRDWDQALHDPLVDIVYVVSPHSEHKRMALLAITVGKHFLIEKPVALTTAEAREISSLTFRLNCVLLPVIQTCSGRRPGTMLNLRQ